MSRLAESLHELHVDVVGTVLLAVSHFPHRVEAVQAVFELVREEIQAALVDLAVEKVAEDLGNPDLVGAAERHDREGLRPGEAHRGLRLALETSDSPAVAAGCLPPRLAAHP